MKPVCLTHVHVTVVETVNASALPWPLTLNPVIKLASVYDGEPLRSAVSNQIYFFFLVENQKVWSH